MIARFFSVLLNWQAVVPRVVLKTAPFPSAAINYAMDNIDKIAAPDWLPDDEDILYARLRTTGINETHFVTQGYEWNCIRSLLSGRFVFVFASLGFFDSALFGLV